MIPLSTHLFSHWSQPSRSLLVPEAGCSGSVWNAGVVWLLDLFISATLIILRISFHSLQSVRLPYAGAAA
jgi:hypothetical protein